jgi:hypothetical protein
MSGQMSSSEIEDMLSSVRRLVSEDFRPTPKPQIVSKMVVEDKLILTPALRVVSSSFAAKPMQGASVQVAQSQDMSVPASPVGVASVQSAAVQINPVRVASDQAASVPNLSEEVASVQASSGSAVPIEAGLAQTPSTAPRPAVGPLPRLHLGAELEIAPTTPNVVATLSQAVDRQSGLDWDAETAIPSRTSPRSIGQASPSRAVRCRKAGSRARQRSRPSNPWPRRPWLGRLWPLPLR